MIKIINIHMGRVRNSAAPTVGFDLAFAFNSSYFFFDPVCFGQTMASFFSTT
jgi:hypothetical protein